MNTVLHPLDEYVLGHSDAETDRLILQHQLDGPITRQIFTSAATFPPARVHDQLTKWVTPTSDTPGVESAMGPKLFGAFVRAGLPTPELRRTAPVGGGHRWPGYAYLAASVRSLIPSMEQLGIITPGSIDIETLEERLRTEVVEDDGIQQLPPVIGARARTAP